MMLQSYSLQEITSKISCILSPRYFTIITHLMQYDHHDGMLE